MENVHRVAFELAEQRALRAFMELATYAQRVANGVITTLTNAKATAANRATELHQSAHEEADAEFGPKHNRGGLESEIRTWVRTEVAKPHGIGKEAALSNRDVANVIWHSPSFLVGLNEGLHAEYRYEALQKWLPDSYLKLAELVELEKIAPKFDAAIGGVRQTFFSPGIAAEAATRVEV
jgi:hypothetical protein